MPGYQRFIAYVYEYRKGKKENNCGFVKVEVRNQRCTMEVHLHCPGLTSRAECSIYGFIRQQGLMKGILLGRCETGEGIVECLLETDSRNMGNSGLSLDKMGGMVITTNLGGFFGTEWDDNAIRPENFQEMKPEPEVKERVEIQPQSEKDTKTETGEKTELQPGPEPEPETVRVPDTQPEKSVETRLQIEGFDRGQEDSDEGNTEEAVEVAEVKEEDASARPPVADPHPGPGSRSPQMSRSQPRPGVSFGEAYCPFEDGEMTECWKIQPRDFMYFPRREASLRNNRFLLYGYYNFGHLLLCRKTNGQYIIGVPGGYDQQERFMANMFGFPYFKESRQLELPKGRGGYWYRLINAPDFH